MSTRALVIVAAAVMILFCVGGCKKSPDEGQGGGSEEAPTMAEYRAEAEKEITRENMDDELARLEKEIEQDVSEE